MNIWPQTKVFWSVLETLERKTLDTMLSSFGDFSRPTILRLLGKDGKALKDQTQWIRQNWPQLSLIWDGVFDSSFLTASSPSSYLPDGVIVSEHQLMSLPKKIFPWTFVRLENHQFSQWEKIEGIVLSRKMLSQHGSSSVVVPLLVKEWIQKANLCSKMVFIEGDLLSSMIAQPTPTRAEVSDVANAVYDGTDGVILAEELSEGLYPLKALELCHSIISDAERCPHETHLNWLPEETYPIEESDGAAFYALKTAVRMKAKALVCVTKAGHTPLKLSGFRMPTPIVAMTFNSDLIRKIDFIRGVKSFLLPDEAHLDDLLPMAKERLLALPFFQKGDPIVFVSISLADQQPSSNLFTIQTL